MKNIIVVFARDQEEARQKAALELNATPESIIITKLDNPEEDALEGAAVLESQFKAEVKEEHLADQALSRLKGLLDAMKIKAQVRSSVVGNLIHLQISSPEKSLVIGTRGSTLEAIEHFVNRTVNGGHKDLPFVLIDVEGYNDKRYQRLEREAIRAAKQVKKTNRRMSLRPMRPDDRKIIHNVIRGIEGIVSFSQGQERTRRVVIAPQVEANNQKNHRNPEIAGGMF